MGLRLSFIFDDPHVFSHVGKAAGVTGQNLSLLALLKEMVKRPEVEVTEVLIDPRMLADQEAVVGLADAILAPELRGQGRLQVLPFSYIPEIWGDGQERLIFCHDIATLVRDRQLRDRWAAAPSPLFWDTHNQATGALQLGLAGAKGLLKAEFDRILCLSDYLMEGYRRLFSHRLSSASGGPPARLDLLRRSLITSQFTPAQNEAEKLQLRRQHGLPPEANIAVFMSRLTPAAKADLAPLVESFCADAEQGEVLVIAGPENSPGYLSALRGLIPSTRHHQVVLLDHIKPDERRSFLAACDFFVFPGDFLMEGAGLVIAEALGCGLPVVCSDLDGFREVITHGVNGLKARTVILPGFERSEAVAGLSNFFLDGIQQAQCVWIDHEDFMSSFWQMMRDDPFRRRASSAAIEGNAHLNLESYLSRLFEMAHESLEWARADEAVRVSLRQAALDQGPPAIFWDLYRFGGTEEASPASLVQITAKGRDALMGSVELFWYADLLSFRNPGFHHRVLSALEDGLPRTMSEICEWGSAAGLSESDSFFQIGLLLKQNCLRIQVLWN